MVSLSCGDHPLLESRKLSSCERWRLIRLMTFELLLITIIGLPLQLEGKAASTHQLAQQADTCTEAELEDLTDRWRESYIPAAGGLRTCGAPAVPGLIEVMTDEAVDLNIRLLSARLLAQIGSEEAVIALLDATSDEALQAGIYQAFRVLNRDSLSAVPLLESALGSPEISRATAAAKGLARIASADAIDALLKALREAASQEAAFIGLGEINPNSSSAVDVLIAALGDESEIVQVGAAYGLAEIGPNAEASIPELAELLRVSEWESLHPNEGSEARGMAAYALGKINPLHEEALKALSITASLLFPQTIEDTLYLREPKEEVREIASEALDEIDNTLLFMNWLMNWNEENYIEENYVWHIIALNHQSDSEFLEALNQVLSEENIDPSMLLRTIQFIGNYPHRFLNMTDKQKDLIVNHLLGIIESQNIDLQTRYYTIRVLFIFTPLGQQQDSYSVDRSVAQRLIQIAENEGEDFEIRQGAIKVIYELFYGIDYNTSPELQEAVGALIGLAKDSHLYSLWNEGYEQLRSQGVIDWNDIGAVAIASLLKINDWSYCSSVSLLNEPCVQNQASPAGIFLRQLEQENPEFFEALRQNVDLSNSFGGLQVESFALAASVSRHQRNNQPAVCQYRLAQRLVPRCR